MKGRIIVELENVVVEMPADPELVKLLQKLLELIETGSKPSDP